LRNKTETFYNCHRPHASIKGKARYEIPPEKLQSNPTSTEAVSSTVKERRGKRYCRRRWKVERSFAWINRFRRLDRFLEVSQKIISRIRPSLFHRALLRPNVSGLF
jgi:transposase